MRTKKQEFSSIDKENIEITAHRMMDGIQAPLFLLPPRLHERCFDMFLFCLARKLMSTPSHAKLVKYLEGPR